MLWHKLIGLAILSLVLTQLGSVQSDVAASGCRNSFSPVAGKCLLANNSYYNWFEADRNCRSVGAELLSLKNETQLRQITEWLNYIMPWTLELWTSGNSLGGKQNSYYWQNSGEEARYLPWARDQPKPADGECLTLNMSEFNSWGSFNYSLTVRNCSSIAPFVCEQEVQKFTTRICLKSDSYENAQVLA
ncbi:hypothetical protein ACLKA7_000380 [Drosophila subpalustris]